jgi:ATP-dependent exoDNAse (exonuclease V) alpha subunit
MAIYHLRAQVISRGAGRNAVNAAAYRRGATMRDEQTFETFSYAHKRDIAHSELAMPESAPGWAQALIRRHEKDPVAASEALWNRVEAHEKRGDAQLAHEIEIALPSELSLDENIALVRAFVGEQLVSRGMAADWSIHLGKNDNVHAHIMLTMRPLSEDGFGAKKVAVLDEAGVPKRDKSGRIQYYMAALGAEKRTSFSFANNGPITRICIWRAPAMACASIIGAIRRSVSM